MGLKIGILGLESGIADSDYGLFWLINGTQPPIPKSIYNGDAPIGAGRQWMSVRIAFSWKVMQGDTVVLESPIEIARPEQDSLENCPESESIFTEPTIPMKQIVLPSVTGSIYPGLQLILAP